MGTSASTAHKVAAPIRILGLTLAFIALTTFFIFATFPYTRLRDPIANQLESLTGASIRIGALESHFGLLGPGLRAESVIASFAGAARQSLEYVLIRPGWSLSWLSGVPSLHIQFEGTGGGATGTLRMGDQPAWEGEFRELNLSLLPLDDVLGGSGLSGLVNAEVDVAVTGEDGPPLVGSIRFEAHDGSFRLPDLPIALPFDTLEGDLVLGGELHAKVNSLSLEGPMLRARLKGDIGGGRGGSPALDLVASVQSDASPVHSVLRGYGVESDAEGNASFHIGGTAARPAIRSSQ